MMKKITLILLTVIVSICSLTACSVSNDLYSDNDQSIEKDITKYINLRQIADGGFDNYSRYIYVDDNTGVLYIEKNSGFSPIYNADGSLKNISDYE